VWDVDAGNGVRTVLGVGLDALAGACGALRVRSGPTCGPAPVTLV
jgi:hypothetical protein